MKLPEMISFEFLGITPSEIHRKIVSINKGLSKISFGQPLRHSFLSLRLNNRRGEQHTRFLLRQKRAHFGKVTGAAQFLILVGDEPGIF